MSQTHWTWNWSCARNGFALVLGLVLMLSACSLGPEQEQDAGVTKPTAESASPTSIGLTTYSAEAVDAAFTFKHPPTWSVKDASNETNGSATVAGPDDAPLGTLEILLVWGGVCGGPVCTPQPVLHLGDMPGEQPLSGSGDFVVRTVAIDLSAAPEVRRTLGWNDNVRLVTSLTDAEVPVPAMMAPLYMYGLGQIETETVASNGTSDRTALFIFEREFATVGKAQEYVHSQQHRDVQSMIASFRG